MNPIKSKVKVFISYAREDEKEATRLFYDLQRHNISAWFDKKSILAGQNWREAIRKAIRECDYFIAILSNRSVSKRGFIQKEIKEAIDILGEFPENAIFLIPVRIDDCRPPYSLLNEIQWIDFFPDWDFGLSKLMKSISINKDFIVPKNNLSAAVIVCDFRNFSESASKLFIGERYSEYILHNFLIGLGKKVFTTHGSDRGRWHNWVLGDRGLVRDSPPLYGDVVVASKGDEDNEFRVPSDSGFLYKDEIGIFIQPQRMQAYDFRELLQFSKSNNTFSAYVIVAGSIDEPETGKYRALVRVVWLTQKLEMTLFMEEVDFNEQNIWDSAISLSNRVSQSIEKKIQISSIHDLP
jgi:hypothetical protein